MTIQSNLKDVFDFLKREKIVINLNESYCSGPKPDLKEKKSWICAAAQDDNRIMEDINEEGSAEVTWNFGPKNKIDTIASLLVKTFTKKGYIVKWNKNMGGQITAVIEIDDLPRSFLEKWTGDISEEEEDILIEKRVDPDAEVLFNDDDEDNTNFSEEEDDYDDDDDDSDIKTEIIIDPSTEEENSDQDDDTLCPKNCQCINCKEELEK
jgi:hypothetical protein